MVSFEVDYVKNLEMMTGKVYVLSGHSSIGQSLAVSKASFPSRVLPCYTWSHKLRIQLLHKNSQLCCMVHKICNEHRILRNILEFWVISQQKNQ